MNTLLNWLVWSDCSSLYLFIFFCVRVCVQVCGGHLKLDPYFPFAPLSPPLLFPPRGRHAISVTYNSSDMWRKE